MKTSMMPLSEIQEALIGRELTIEQPFARKKSYIIRKVTSRKSSITSYYTVDMYCNARKEILTPMNISCLVRNGEVVLTGKGNFKRKLTITG